MQIYDKTRNFPQKLYLCGVKTVETNIERTADGSATLYRADIDEHYHSVKGALTESLHVYIREGLLHRAKSGAEGGLRVLEVGFGTGLNAALTASEACEALRVHYTSLELYPLDADTVAAMGYGAEVPLLEAVNRAEWDVEQAVGEYFTLHKRVADFLTDALPAGIDVVYFDAFAPEKQPEMWSEDCFRRIYNCMNEGGVLLTYCAKGAIRRLLASIGFTVERIAGPPGGKREILRATKMN